MDTSNGRDTTEETRAVLAGRAAAVARMFAGKAGYEEVLAFHAPDFVWLSAAGVRVGLREARRLQRERMAAVPPETLTGVRMLRHVVAGEYGFVMFKSDLLPFGSDTFRVVNGRVVFQSNALYLPSRLRPGKSATTGVDSD